MKPRIYTYKVTFEEIPDWYWGVHKERKYGESYLGSPVSHAWKWDFYTPFLEILELFPYTEEGWAEACGVEKRCIRPDLNNPLCLNENVGGSMSLEMLKKGSRKANKIIHAEKNELGKSVIAVKASIAAHKEKNENGKSVTAVKAATAAHKEKNKNGKSVNAVKGGEAIHRKKNKNGNSVNALKAGKAARDKLGKRVVVTFPNGFQRSFNSVREVSRFLGHPHTTISDQIERGLPTKRSRFFGYNFEYA
jgi:hypothetical protein